MKDFKKDSTSTLSRFGRDKRERTATVSAERVERRPRPQRDAADSERSSFGTSERRSYNPNFTADNRPVSGDRPRRDFGDKPAYGNRDSKPYGNREDKPYGDRPRRDFGDKPAYGNRDSKPYGNREDKPYGDRPRRDFGDKPAYGNRDSKPYGNREDKPYGDRPRRDFGDKPAYGNRDSKPYGNREDKPYGDRPRRDFGDKPAYGDRDRKFGDKPAYGNRDSKPYGNREDKPYGDRPRRDFGDKPAYGDRDRKFGDKPAYGNRDSKPYGDRPRRDFGDKPAYGNRDRKFGDKPAYRKSAKPSGDYPRYDPNKQPGEMRLNRYIAQSGICSRREADEFIQAGLVSVNGAIVTELGTKVMPSDEVKFNDSRVQGEKKVYLVLNKPKGYVTTLEDPHADKTVIELVKDACTERIYPVGRLDKNSLGLLLFTNDGDLTKQLTHPAYGKKKIYQVSLDRALERADMDRIAQGVTLEDGDIFADEIAYVKDNKKEVGVEIHSGRNRIVRRIFEHLGYTVTKLDRVYYAGLTKKNLKRGAWRFLSREEVERLISGRYE